MSGIRTRMRQVLKRRVLFISLLITTVIGLATFSFGTVFASGELGLGLTAVDTDGNPITTVQSGDIIEYIIDYSCADLTYGCGTLDIQFTLDLSLVEFVEVITSPSYDGSFTSPTVFVTNDPVINPTFDGGESAQARVRVRVLDGLDGTETIPATVVGDISNSNPSPGVTEVTVSSPAIDVVAPTEQWDIIKRQVVPTLPTEPAPGGIGVFAVEFCPQSTIGNISITDPILIDNYPPGTIVLDSGGGVVDTLNNTITWTPPVLDNPLNPADGCETVTYTLEFPDTDFAVNDPYTNSAVGDGSNPEIDPAGICVSDCANDTINGTLNPPTAELGGTVSKGGPGSTTIVAPGDSSGTSVYTLGLDLSGSNTYTNAGVTLTDILPTAPSDGIPATSITQINSGTWGTAPDGSAINAIIEITTTANPTFTQLGGTFNGSTNQQFTSAGGDFIGPGNGGALNDTTNLVTGIRITFLSPLPPGFTFTSDPNFRFIVREGMSMSAGVDDYDDGGGTRTYQNCVDVDGTYDDLAGNPQSTFGNDCTDFQTSDDSDGFANITTSKSSDVESVFPLDPIQFTLTATLTEEASGDLINPAIYDELPPGFSFVSWDSVTVSNTTGGDITPDPYLVIDTSSGQTELLFYWDSSTIEPGSEDISGNSPGSPNPFRMIPPVTGTKTITITFTATPGLSVAAGPNGNSFTIASESPNMRCQGATDGSDPLDIDGDGLTGTDITCGADDSFSVREAAEMAGQKWIRSIDGVDGTYDFFLYNDLDNPSTSCPTFTYQTNTAASPVDFTRYPCVAEGLPTEQFEYLMRAINTGIVDIDNYILVDVLPFIGDTGVSELVEGQDRDTEFLTLLDGPIVVEDVTEFGDPGFTATDRASFTQATFDVEYNLTTNPCRGELANPTGPTTSYPTGCDNTWYTEAQILAMAPPAWGTSPWDNVRSFRIVQNNGRDDSGTGIIPSGGGSLTFSVPMRINGYDGPTPFNVEDGAQTGEIAWNSFAHQFDNALSGTQLLAAEPPKVGIVVAQRYSVGNRVWIDDGADGAGGYNFTNANNGEIDPGEIGVNDVEVQLWRDTGGGFTQYATDITRSDAGPDGIQGTTDDVDGYYFFGDLDGGPNIDYQVRIPGYEFDPADANSDLDTYISSTGNQDTENIAVRDDDSFDTGIDQAVTTASDNYINNGVSSDVFTLTGNNEAQGETDVNDDGFGADGSPPTNEGPLGYGENQEEDEDSDLTVDFGFFKPMSLGNIVWLDDGTGGGTRNDGIINGSEAGIPGVVLGLYASDGTTEIDDPDNPGNHYTATTNADGYYLFDLLPPGEYVVRVMPENFQFGANPTLDGVLAPYISSNAVPGSGAAVNPGDENGVAYYGGAADEDDSADHGIDPATDGDQRTEGIYSAIITLTPDIETSSEDVTTPPLPPSPVDGRRATANNSDLTVDFGFFQESDNNFSLGNFVWEDLNNNGIYDAEPVLPDVEIALWSVDASGNPLAVLATTKTDAQGYYLFDSLDPGRYIVQMTANNWNNAGSVDPTLADLSEYISTTGTSGDTETDQTNASFNENGNDPVDGDVTANNTVTDEYQANGVFSAVILLEPEGEPTGEDSNQANPGAGSGDAEDDNSDLTVDFGVYRPMSIGNIVWRDNGADSATVNLAQYNDGVFNGTEAGVADVTVELYGDFDGDGVEDVTPRTTLTDGAGYYLFDGLTQGDYRVEIPISNFAPGGELVNLISSYSATPPPDNTLDDNDHGIDVADPTSNPVVSSTIELRYDQEDTGEQGSGNATDGPNSRGNNGETDLNSDLTVDFGFVAPPMSIGNRVWRDEGDDGAGGYNSANANNGEIDPGESGIDDVVVNLYLDIDNNGDGYPDGPAIATDITAGGGYYLFDNLPPGDYVVGIPASNFTTSGELVGYYSSTDGATTPVDPDLDENDHGIDPAVINNEVFSPPIELATNSESTADDETGTGTGNNGETDVNSDLTVDFGFVRPMSIGNRVWLDIDRTTGTPGDGILQTGEDGVANVALELYLDNGTTPGVLDGSDTLVAEATTNATGHYLFDETTTVTAPGTDDPYDSPLGPGNYLVHIPASNFGAGQPLEGRINSDGTNGTSPQPDTPTDNPVDTGNAGIGLENGVDANPATPATYPETAGVTSTTIVLAYDTELTSESDRDPALDPLNDPIDGVNVQDINGDFSVDFGFYNALAIGNRVWFDSDRNGLIDDAPGPYGNPGIDNVTVYLYQDADGNGVPDGAPIAQDVTDADGYYLFDVLDTNAGTVTGDGDDAGGLIPPGTYLVGIDPTAGINADPLVLGEHVSTITIVGGQGNDADIDSDDNGIDSRDVDPDPTIIYSEPIVLAHFTEVTTEPDRGPEGDGNYGIQNYSSNLTVDFGFYIPMSIGNRVWFDSNNDGVFTPGDINEPGLNGVIVELFRDFGSGIDLANDTPYRTTVTNTDTGPDQIEGTADDGGDGYYIFDDLPEGDYIVRLAPENFQPDDGNPANGVEGVLLTGDGPYSSSESGGTPQSDYLVDNQTDNNDNGIDENLPQTFGIASNIITLEYGSEPTPDTDLDGDVDEGTFGEQDDNADMTVDFGVYRPAMSIGNRVFYDYNNDRIFNGADRGVENVIVNLFEDTDNNGVPDSGITNPIATVQTDADGYYLFDGLEPGLYLVQIDEDNFRTVTNGVLQDYYSSQDKDNANNPVPPTDDQNDTIENGVDNPFNLANNPDPQAQGVFSPTIQLVGSSETITETDLGPEGDGEPNIQASNSDLTVDFGFYQPMSIGNVVWFDTNEDGLFNGTEAGIAGVEVVLYRDNGDGVFSTATDTVVQVFDGAGYANSDITDANGYYLFDNLLAGQYFVHIPLTNFAGGNALFDHISTQPENVSNPGIAPAPDIDSNDNGTPNDNTATTVGVTSELITLGIIDPVNGSGLYIPNSSEPVNELDKSNNPPTPASTYDGPASIGRYGEIDENSDITIDFGFILENNASMSIGNRVWYDEDRSGLIESTNVFGNDEASTGIDGVLVFLYRADTAGNPIGNPIARDVTQNGGYYLFDVLDTDATTGTGDGDDAGGPLTPGNYVVAIDSSNFTSGNVLEGYTSTVTGTDNTGVAPATATENTYLPVRDDNNDNGTANATYGILSDLVTLTLQAERADEDAANQETGVFNGTDGNGNPITANNSNLTIDFGFYPPMSIGNRVWIDGNNNGVFDTTETAVPNGVTLTLYQDTDNSGDYTPGVDVAVDNPNNPGNPYQVSTTNGYYLFENLLPADDYIVVMDASNFNAGGNLVGYTGSNNGSTFEDDTDTDLNDNGRDTYTPATDGIPSGLIELTVDGEPTGEQGSTNPADGPDRRGNNGETDLNSNLTVDFGVFPSTYYSIGNRVWSDTNNDGIHDSSESGIQGVIVNLYQDANGDGTPDSLSAVASTTTDANGYYIFDSLPEGSYVVSIAPQNFNTGGSLIGYSTTTQADPTDSNPNDDEDNVSDHNNSTIDPDFGILSNTYDLSGATEPTGEADPTPAGTPQDPGTDPSGNPIPDNQSNLTVDFGFIQTMSLGNRVWFDLNDDGLITAGETGIAGVDVILYLDDGATSPGVFDPAEDTQVAIDTTDGNGYYLFNDLQPGDYFVNIPNSNWAGPLANMQSSTPDAAANDTVDSNDNGTPNTVAPTDGVTSALITMAFGTAPTGEADLSNNPLDGTNFRGTSNPADNNSNLTIDFGFFLSTPMSIGNRVWIDDGNTTGTPNDGIINGDEEGVPNVIVELYADSNGDGIPDTTTPIDTVNTDADGYYLFDGLPPGQYVVVLPEDNWTNGTLDGYLSTQTRAQDNDSQDNGVDNPTPSVDGIRSSTIILEIGNEPTADDETVTGTGTNGETDDNSNLTVDFGLVTAYDWGDAPDSYGTTDASGGPSHRIISGLYMGSGVDDEGDGQAVTPGTSNNTGDPDGDGTDEDGMVPPIFVAGTTVDVDVTVTNTTGQPATLVGWFDWNGDGVFDAGEGATVNVPAGTDGVVQLTVTIPPTAQDDTGGFTYARLRLTNDAITTSDPTGSFNSGEVEDYYVEVRDPGILVNKSDGRNSIVAGTYNTYTITIENSGADRLGVRFLDDIPIASATDATGYDPETITWTCVATNGASCIANSPAGTGSSGGPYPDTATAVSIDELIDLPRNGRVVYTITAQVNEQAGLVPLGGSGPLVNTAELPNEVPPITNTDETDVIFDPPFGVKTGVANGNNIIRWTMVWYNPGAQQAGVTIGDDIVSPQQLPATAAAIDLQCSGGGAGGTNTGTCSIVGNRIEWNGTMDTSTIANPDAAVTISFNVTVPGPGNYPNTGTINIPGQPPVSSASTVAIDGGGNVVSLEQLDPVIVKFVDPALALPGEDVTWTIVVRNPNSGIPVDNVFVTDSMPSQLDIISTSASAGTVTVNGQDIRWQIGTLAPLQEVTLTVVSQLADPTDRTPVITNTAYLNGLIPASADVYTVGELPETGEVPWWRTMLIALVGVAGGGIALVIGAGHIWSYVRRD